MPFVPHTTEDARRILRRLGIDSEEELFSHIPPSIKTGGMDLPEPMDEETLSNRLAALAAGETEPGVGFGGESGEG